MKTSTKEKPSAEEKEKVAKAPKKVSIEAPEGGEDASFTTVGKSGKAVEIATTENLFKKLKELMDMRGKKSTDRLVMIQQLRSLLQVASTPYQKTRVLLALIPAEFDYTTANLGYMAVDIWKRYG